LRSAWQTVDDRPHVHGFLDMHDLGDLLVRSGFAEPVMDVERFTLTYADVLGVLSDLKRLGAHNTAHGRARGLTGKQGVIIPRDNVRHLMLKDEVMQAVRDGTFHVWAIESIDQGIELLTGVPAGERRADGTYADGTVNYLVERQLHTFAERLKEFRPGSVSSHAEAMRSRERREAARQWRGEDVGRHRGGRHRFLKGTSGHRLHHDET